MEHHHNQKVTITHEEINGLPLSAFEGHIELVDDAKHLAKAF